MRHIYWKIIYKRVLFGTYMTDEKPHPFCFDRRIFIMIATQSTHFPLITSLMSSDQERSDHPLRWILPVLAALPANIRLPMRLAHYSDAIVNSISLNSLVPCSHVYQS